jgi:transglutaminase-like putative cysteine protease
MFLGISFSFAEDVIGAMVRVRKVHAAKRRRQTRKWVVAFSILLLVALLVGVAYVWVPRDSANSVNSQPEASPSTVPTTYESSPFTVFTDHYLGVMQNLNSTQTKAKMAPLLNPSFNQTDLFSWEKTKMTFASDPTGSFENPVQILSRGTGICVQWSIVYVSACLALGYQSRLAVAVDASSWSFIHVWAEDFCNGTWVHVDPSDFVWNNPSRYQSWDWGRYLGSQVKVYAFEDGAFQDVTSTYDANLG